MCRVPETMRRRCSVLSWAWSRSLVLLLQLPLAIDDRSSFPLGKLEGEDTIWVVLFITSLPKAVYCHFYIIKLGLLSYVLNICGAGLLIPFFITSCVVGRGCSLWLVHSLGRILLTFALYTVAKFSCWLQMFLHSSIMKRTSFWGVLILGGSCRSS